MRLGTQTTRAKATANGANASTPRDSHASNATHGKKLPVSNRQFLVRLETPATRRKQSAAIDSNRHFWDLRAASASIFGVDSFRRTSTSTPYTVQSRNRVKPFKMRNLKISNTYKWTLLRAESCAPVGGRYELRAGRPRRLKHVPRRAARPVDDNRSEGRTRGEILRRCAPLDDGQERVGDGQEGPTIVALSVPVRERGNIGGG
jgi:hypothetical protein